MLDILRPFLAAPPNLEALTEVSEPVVLIRGDYPNYYQLDSNGKPKRTEGYKYRSHTFSVFVPPNKPGQRGFQTFREVICSCGPDPHAPKECTGCYQVDHGAKDSKPREQVAFNMVHLAWYHHHPLVGQDGQVRMGNNKQPMMVKDECLTYKKENEVLYRAAQRHIQNIRQAKACDFCAKEQPNAWGDHRILQVGSKHLGNLIDKDTELGKRCATCGTYLMRKFFNCGNESCNQHLVDIAVGMNGWTNEQIKTYADTAQTCPFCGYVGLPYSEWECGLDDQWRKIPGAGCADPEDARETTIFDRVLWIQREGQQTDSEVVVKRVETFAEFKTPDGRSLETWISEIAPQPFDLEEMYKPDTLDGQAETIRIQNPYAQTAQYVPYGQQGFPQQQGSNFPQQQGSPQQSYPGTPGRPNFK
jgi:hypothetical protein